MPLPSDDLAAAPWNDPGLGAWLAEAGCEPSTLRPMPGDVSPRRYARVGASEGGTAIVAAYPAEMRAVLLRFLASTELLAAAGVRVPRVLACDAGRGWVLQEDLGERTLYDLGDRPWAELAPWLDAAAEAARRVGALPLDRVNALGSPPLDGALLSRELDATFDVLLLPHGLVAPGEERELREALGELCTRLGGAPPVACHRDFMARNLVPLADLAIGVLDHQDLRAGPRWYDLASLANDSLFVPTPLAERWLERSGAVGGERTAYHRAAAQRGLKAAGTFARFAARGVPRHLPLIPPTLRRAIEHLALTPEGEEMAARLAPRWQRELARGLC